MKKLRCHDRDNVSDGAAVKEQAPEGSEKDLYDK